MRVIAKARIADTRPSRFGIGSLPIERLAFGSLWLFVFAIPWEYQLSVPFIGTISRLLGAIATLLAVLAVSGTGRIRLPNRFGFLTTLFFGWASMTYAWTLHPKASLVHIETYGQLFVMVVLVWHFSERPEDLRSLMGAYVLGSCISAASVILNYLAHRQSIDPDRYTAGEFGPNELAITLAWTVPVAWLLACSRQGSKPIWLCQFHLPLIAGAVLLTASRGGAITLLVTALAIPLSAFHASRRRTLRFIAPCAVALICLVVSVPLSSWQRLATTTAEVRSGSMSHREEIWKAGWQTFESGNELAGIGSGAYAPHMATVLGREAVAHNSFMSILVETGIGGALLFSGVLASLFLAVGQMTGVSRVIWLVALAGWITGVMSMTGESMKATWLLFSLASSSAAATVERGT